MSSFLGPSGKYIDPIYWMGLYPTKSDELALQLQRAKQEYSRLWDKWNSKGFPMELLGYPEPEVVLLEGGIGGGPPGLPGLPGFIPPSAAQLQRPANTTQQQVERQNNINEQLENEMDFLFQNAEESKEFATDVEENVRMREENTRMREEKETKEEKEEKEEIGEVKTYYIRPKESNKRKKLAERVPNNRIIGRTIMVRIFETLAAQKRSLLKSVIGRRGGRMKQKDKLSLLRKILADEDVNQEILDVFTNSGINLEGLSTSQDALQVVNQINSRTGLEALLLINDILEVFHRNADNSLRFNDDEVEYFRPIDTTNLLHADVDAELRLPYEIPGLYNSVLEMLVDADVDRNIASRFTIRLLNRVFVMTDYFIDTLGGRDVGVAKANQYLEKLIRDVIKEVGKEKSKVIINVPKLMEFFMETIQTAPKAIKDYVGNLKSDKYKVIKTLIQELITPAEGTRPPPMRSTEIEAVRNDLDRNIDATLPNELNVRNWIFEEERNSNSDSDSDESLVEFVNNIGIPPEELYEPLPTGNIIINSSRLGAQIIMRWNNENRLIGYGDYGIYFEESGRITPGGDLDEAYHLGGDGGGPPGPPGGPDRSIDIVFETPRGNRRIGFKNFIKALVIIGLSASSIAGIVESLKSTNKNNKKSININKDKNKKINITIIDRPRTEQDMYKKLSPNEPPSRSVSTDLRTGGANRLGITNQIREFGLEDNVNQYNEIVAKFNKAIQSRDKGLVDKYKTELDEAWKPIYDKFVLQDRPVDPFQFPETDVKLNLSELQGEEGRKSDTLYLKSPTKIGELLRYIQPTKEQLDAGLEDTIKLVNTYIIEYNNASMTKDYSKMAEFQSKLNRIARWVNSERVKPQEDVVKSDDIESYEKELILNVNKYNMMRRSGSSEDELNKQALKIQQTREKYIQLRSEGGEGVKYETYLPENLIRQEVFPKTAEQSFKFNELQRLERILQQHVNPNDVDNKAKQEYIDYVSKTYGVGSVDPMKFYQNRIDKIKERLRANNIEEYIVEDFEQNEKKHRQQVSGDDEYTDITFQGKQTEETITPQEREEGDLRPSFKSGGEAHKLVSTPDEMEEENKKWREFSLVRPGFGNGGMKDNSLFRHNMREEQLRFMPLRSPPLDHQPPLPPPHHPSRQTQFTNIYQINDRFLPINHHGNDKFGFTPERLTSTEWNEFENNRNGYMPEHVLARHRDKPTRILGLRPDGQGFVPYSYTYGEAIKPIDYHHQGGRVMDEDILYENAKGFRTYQPEDNYAYERAIKKHY